MNTNKFKSLKDIVEEKCKKQVLPFQSGKHLKTLKDICLEFCSSNFEEVFIEKTEDKNRLKKSVALHPFIFEEIHDKSRKIGCYIYPHLLKLCLGFRAALNWQNIDLDYLTYARQPLTLEDLKNIAKDETPVRKLSFCSSGEVTEKSLLYISKFASTLEHLAIGPDSSCLITSGTGYDAELVSKLRETKIKMPNLKFLKLSFNAMSLSVMDMIDIESFKDSLKVLKLHSYHTHFDRINKKYNTNCDTKYFIDVIKSCKNVTSLSLSRCYFEQEEGEQIFEVTTSMMELKSLDLFGVRSFLRREKFNLDFIAFLPKLENLEISCGDFHWMDRNYPDNIHLKYFGAYDVQNEYSFLIRADVIAHWESLEGLLNSIEYAGHIHIYAVEKLAELLSPTFSRLVTDDEWYRVERVLMLNISRNPYRAFSLPQKMMEVIKRPDLYPYWTSDFLAMTTRHHMIT